MMTMPAPREYPQEGLLHGQVTDRAEEKERADSDELVTSPGDTSSRVPGVTESR
jgi:hypothetical protein